MSRNLKKKQLCNSKKSNAMKQILSPEDINLIEQVMNKASPAPWNIIYDNEVDTAWVVPSNPNRPIALFDYNNGDQNKADAHFTSIARNYIEILVSEVKTLRKRTLELIQANNAEIRKRLDMQTELEELKKLLQSAQSASNSSLSTQNTSPSK